MGRTAPWTVTWLCYVASCGHVRAFVFPGSLKTPSVAPTTSLKSQARCRIQPTALSTSSFSRDEILRQVGATVFGVSLGLNPMLVEGAPVDTSTSGAAVTGQDRSMVLATTDIWRDTVTSQTPNAPKATAALYAPDAVLWGTVSEEVRDTPEEILDYFEYFACLPGLSLIEYNPVAVRVYGDFATNVGTYTFAWTGEGGEKKEKRARYSFTYRRDPNCLTGWAMVEHHSSAMPVSPPALKHARS